MSCVPVRFVFGNAVRRSIIRSDGQLGDINHLKTEHRSRLCRWPVSEPVVIEIELASTDTRDIDTIALSRHNISKRGVITVELLNSKREIKESLTLRRMEPGALPTRKPCTEWRPCIDSLCGQSVHDVVPWPATIVAWLSKADGVPPSFVRITIDDAWNESSKIEVGMLFGGRRLEMNYNFDWGNGLSGLSDGQVSRLASGYGVRSALRRRVRALNFNLSLLTDRDREQFYFEDDQYPNEPLLCSAYPEGQLWQQDQYTLIGLLSQSPNYSHTRTSNHGAAINIIEV